MKHFEINEIFEILERKDKRLKELETHITECAECRENFEKVKEFLYATEIEVPFDARVKVRNKVYDRIKKRKRFKLIFVPSLVTSLAAILVIFIFLNINKRKKEELIIFSPENESVLTPEEVLFALKVKKLKDFRIYIDDLDITDSMRMDGNIFYYLAENLELSPGPHFITIVKENNQIVKRKFYLTSFKYSAGY